MSKLSRHTAQVYWEDWSATPISVELTLDEAWTPYVQATVVIPSNQEPDWLNPEITQYMGLRLQQDFGDILYVHEVTADFGGSCSAITAGITPMKPATFTARYVHPFIPGDTTPIPPSAVFNGSKLNIRSISRDFITKETTINLASVEALLDEITGFPSDLIFVYPNLRAAINSLIPGDLEPGAANVVTEYQIRVLPNETYWEYIDKLVKQPNFVFYSDETGRYYLDYATAVAGSLELSDQDNITAFTHTIDRDRKQYYQQVTIQWPTISMIPQYEFTSGPGKSVFIDYTDRVRPPGTGTAAALRDRAVTRGDTYQIEALANYEARPRQAIEIDVTGMPLMSGVVQSVSWSLPAGTMAIELRDLEEVP